MIKGFLQTDRLNSQKLSFDVLFWHKVFSAQCVIVTDNYTEIGLNCNYRNANYSQAHGDFVFDSRHLNKVIIIQQYITQAVFRGKTDGNQTGYKIYVFEVRYHQEYSAHQPNKRQFIFSEVNCENTNTFYALVSTI